MHEGVPHMPLSIACHGVERSGVLWPAGPIARVPTLLATRLQLDLLLGERAVDLRAAAGIVLNDVGATLAVFARTYEETGGPLPERIEDCLASLGTEAWLEAIGGDAVERVDNAGEVAALHAFWEHGRRLAYATWLAADAYADICPEQAYLVGLLHEVGRMPALLGWDAAVSPESLCLRLPRFLQPVLCGDAMPALWREVLAEAHAWSSGKHLPLRQIA